MRPVVQDARSHSPATQRGHGAEVATTEHVVEHERPEDWGWHGEMGKWGRRLAIIPILFILAYLFGNHRGRVEDIWLIAIAALMILVLVYDRYRRKNAWRAK